MSEATSLETEISNLLGPEAIELMKPRFVYQLTVVFKSKKTGEKFAKIVDEYINENREDTSACLFCSNELPALAFGMEPIAKVAYRIAKSNSERGDD